MEPETETERDRECPRAEKRETGSADRKPERENRKKPSRRSADRKTKDTRDDQTVVHRPEKPKDKSRGRILSDSNLSCARQRRVYLRREKNKREKKETIYGVETHTFVVGLAKVVGGITLANQPGRPMNRDRGRDEINRSGICM